MRGRGRLAVARDVQGRLVGRHANPRDVGGRPAGASHQRERPVDGGEGMPAAAVVLEGHGRDVEDLAQPLAGVFPVGPIAHGPAQARFAVDHVQRTGDAFARGEGREQAGFRGAAGMQGLRHRVHAEGLLQPRGEGGHRGERVRELRAVQAQKHRRRGCAPEAADGAGRMPVAIVRPAQGGADPRRDLVAGDDGAQEFQAARLPVLRQGERGRDGRGARVVDRVAEDVVELDRVRRGAVDERASAGGGAPPEGERGTAAVQLVGQHALEQRGRGDDGAGKERRVPVDDGALRVVDHRRGERLRAQAVRELREALDDEQGRRLSWPWRRPS